MSEKELSALLQSAGENRRVMAYFVFLQQTKALCNLRLSLDHQDPI